jgi:hypothetical protein
MSCARSRRQRKGRSSCSMTVDAGWLVLPDNILKSTIGIIDRLHAITVGLRLSWKEVWRAVQGMSMVSWVHDRKGRAWGWCSEGCAIWFDNLVWLHNRLWTFGRLHELRTCKCFAVPARCPSLNWFEQSVHNLACSILDEDFPDQSRWSRALTVLLYRLPDQHGASRFVELD